MVEMHREDIERIVRIEGSISRLESKLDMVIARFDSNVEDVKKDVDDHDTRIEGLEKWRYGVGGALIIGIISILEMVVPLLPF